jgi:hypothetical protein
MVTIRRSLKHIRHKTSLSSGTFSRQRLRYLDPLLLLSFLHIRFFSDSSNTQKQSSRCHTLASKHSRYCFYADWSQVHLNLQFSLCPHHNLVQDIPCHLLPSHRCRTVAAQTYYNFNSNLHGMESCLHVHHHFPVWLTQKHTSQHCKRNQCSFAAAICLGYLQRFDGYNVRTSAHNCPLEQSDADKDQDLLLHTVEYGRLKLRCLYHSDCIFERRVRSSSLL